MNISIPAPMPAEEARRHIARLGWTQKETAARIGVGSARLMRDYLAPGARLPAASAQLLRLLSAAAPDPPTPEERLLAALARTPDRRLAHERPKKAIDV